MLKHFGDAGSHAVPIANRAWQIGNGADNVPFHILAEVQIVDDERAHVKKGRFREFREEDCEATWGLVPMNLRRYNVKWNWRVGHVELIGGICFKEPNDVPEMVCNVLDAKVLWVEPEAGVLGITDAIP